MLDGLDQLERGALAELSALSDPASLDKWKQSYLGASGKLKAAMASLKDVPKEHKPAFGARVNQLKSLFERAFDERLAALGGSKPVAVTGPMIDLTEPGLTLSSSLGRRHIISRVRDELVDVFARMGFSVAQGCSA
jgi:phenylalanyl-tRNA synthetase alpha chain